MGDLQGFQTYLLDDKRKFYDRVFWCNMWHRFSL